MGSIYGYTCLCVFLTLTSLSCANFPLLDVDTNMRIVLVPADTKVGTIIYRLRASDSDNNFPLSFDILGAVGKSLLSIKPLGCIESESLCQADVILMKPLDLGRSYEFQIQVKDTTGDYTKVQAVITATPGTASTSTSLFGPTILHIPENTPVGAVLEKFTVVKNELNSRTVLLELREPENRLELRQRLLSSNRTEGSLVLRKGLNFEKDPWFTFQLLAMNAQTNSSVDTRNILVSDVIVAVHDVQDAPPVFVHLPTTVEISGTVKPGDLITKVMAEDGDKQNKRLIRYGFLTESNPFVVFFDLDPMTGEIRLKRELSELLKMKSPTEPITMTIIAEEIITENSPLGRSSGSPWDRTVGNITFWVAKGGVYGPPTFSSDMYTAEVKENSVPGTPVLFGLEPRVWHQNQDEIIQLSLRSGGFSRGVSDSLPFDVLPSRGVGNFSFQLRVVDSKLLDYETLQSINLKILGASSSGMTSEAVIQILIRDVNDESPVFTQMEYHVELPEHPPRGTKVVKVKASDRDTADKFGQVVYSGLIGSSAFRLDPLTGEITVDKPELIDREVEPEIRLYVEAKDGGYTEFADSNVVRNIATATVVIKITDKNDHSPEFPHRFYQAVLNTELTSFKSPIFLKAYDRDEGANAQIVYQVQDNRFAIDQITGELRLRTPLIRHQTDGDGPYLGSVRVRAYNLGSPQMSSEAVVQLFSEEMVSREIQFIFPSSPENIRRNQTNIERMLSSLTGGIVGIQRVVPFSSRPLLTQSLPQPNLPKEPIHSVSNRRLNPMHIDEHDHHSAELSSGTDHSLVTATVQYPVSATATRVDLEAWQKAYANSAQNSNDGDNKGNNEATKVIELYKAENRVLFWILIAFLLLLLLLFGIFLCCIYCPCCWLYGYCYRKEKREFSSDGKPIDKKVEKRHGRKTYPADEEASVPYEGGHHRREAWSANDERKGWRGLGQRRYPTPKSRMIVARNPHRGVPTDGDVALEDWEFEPSQRHRDNAEEIGPRWQQMHQQGGQNRRVAYVGHPHPGDEGYVRRQESEPGGNHFGYGPPNHVTELERTQLPRNYPRRSAAHSLPPADSRAQSHFRPRQTRFFRTEAGEVLQFGDFVEGDEGKEMLMKRFIDEQEPQDNEQFRSGAIANVGYERRGDSPGVIQTNGGGRRAIQGGEIPSEGRSKGFVADSLSYLTDQQQSQSERPKAAVVSRRPQRGVRAAADLPELHEEEDEAVSRPERKHHKVKDEDAPSDPNNGRKRHSELHKKRVSGSASEDSHRSTSPTTSRRHRHRSKSKSQSHSHSRSRSKSPIQSTTTTTKSPSRSRSKSLESKVKVKHNKETKGAQQEKVTQEDVDAGATSQRTIQTHRYAKAERTSRVIDKDKRKSRGRVKHGPEPTMKPKQSGSHSPPVLVTQTDATDVEGASEEHGTHVAINIISPSSAKTDSSYNGKDENGEESADSLKESHHRPESSSGAPALQSQPQASQPEAPHEEDEDSGIGIVRVATKRNKMLEKKSVFTIAYDEVAQKVLRPETASGGNTDGEELKA